MRASPSGSVSATDVDDVDVRLLDKRKCDCEEKGISAGWCADVSLLESMLDTYKTWERYGIHALKEDAAKMGAPTDGLYNRADVLLRLRSAMVWNNLQVIQLERECRRRSIPFFPGQRGKHAKKELVSRLIQDAFGVDRGQRSALPVHGIGAIWRPRGTDRPAPSEAWTGQTVRLETDTLPSVASSSSFSSEEDCPKSLRRKHGDRLYEVLKEFAGFSGVVPTRDVADSWSDKDLRAYFYSNGCMKPKCVPHVAAKPDETTRAQAAPSESRSAGAGRGSAKRQERVGRGRGGSGVGRGGPTGTYYAAWGGDEYAHAWRSARGCDPPPRRSQTGRALASPPVLPANACHYHTLGVPPGASSQEVKRAYKALVLRHHPDKNPDQETSRFVQIHEAYEAICRDLS
uniref:J domain-containing protein n=1 Tax=Noctiluca scintillans TaxID=2966 RepID=A0A7S1FI18_NOCSC|mmetsp:Transcript_65338/g.173239  ORF Transcript_65338/g.173239 Transcript_65338/m.173239 type:complete len:402 (+) Transcript_65338:61-1266(+)